MTPDDLNIGLLKAWEILSILAYVNIDDYDHAFKPRADFNITAQSVVLIVMGQLETLIQGVDQWTR